MVALTGPTPRLWVPGILKKNAFGPLVGAWQASRNPRRVQVGGTVNRPSTVRWYVHDYENGNKRTLNSKLTSTSTTID